MKIGKDVTKWRHPCLQVFDCPIKVKKLTPTAKLPEKKTGGSAGFDLYAAEIDTSRLKDFQVLYRTGIAIEIPEGYAGIIYPRSSIRDMYLNLTNSVGVIDSDYRGEITFTFNYLGSMHTTGGYEKKYEIPEYLKHKIYKIGDRIGQLVVMPVPLVYYEEVDELDPTSRGSEGHGSTGRS
jgi:dUTP pyrophosphatase